MSKGLTDAMVEALRKMATHRSADIHVVTWKALERRGLVELVARPHRAFSDLCLTDAGRAALAEQAAESGRRS